MRLTTLLGSDGASPVCSEASFFVPINTDHHPTRALSTRLPDQHTPSFTAPSTTMDSADIAAIKFLAAPLPILLSIALA